MNLKSEVESEPRAGQGLAFSLDAQKLACQPTRYLQHYTKNK